MDRFIGVQGYEKEYLIKNLKSNMDRFIESFQLCYTTQTVYLKSNMDRFIVNKYEIIIRIKKKFKIQYG